MKRHAKRYRNTSCSTQNLQTEVFNHGTSFGAAVVAVSLVNPGQEIANEILDRYAKPFVFGTLLLGLCVALGQA
jgi:hypothetical protein